MKHITIIEYGYFLGVTSARLCVHHKDTIIKEIPLNRIKTITLLQGGCSLSGKLISECAVRGIKIFFTDFRKQIVSALIGVGQHAVSEIRKKQFEFIDSMEARNLSRKFIIGKLKNQRAVLLYFGKYFQKVDQLKSQALDETAEKIKLLIKSLKEISLEKHSDWRNHCMGFEGQSAAIYWGLLKQTNLLPVEFVNRIGRGASDPINSALNYGYAILMTYIWNSIANAGLEVFAGVLHVDRPGRPALVLDLMEEYRAWVVDRNIIKHRERFASKEYLTDELKKLIISEIHSTLNKKFPYSKKELKLETIIQRQVYRVAGEFAGQKKYKPYIFRW